MINIFVAKVLKYKKDIDEGNDKFFLEKSYDDDLSGNSSLTGKIFEFKSI